MSKMVGEPIGPFEFFVSEIAHEDIVIRTDAMSQAAVVCAVMGSDRAREDLLPYLLTMKGEPDQVTLALARALEYFLPYIGGADYAHALIPLFEMLCSAEETVVRAAAAKSCSTVITSLGKDHTKVRDYVELHSKLSGDEESTEEFYSRIAASYMMPALYSVISSEDDLSTLRNSYDLLLGNEMHIVRRAAVSVFSEVFKLATAQVQLEWFVPLLKGISIDENTAVKVMAIEGYESIAKTLHDSNKSALLVSELVPLMKAAAVDESWRVRITVAKTYGNMVTYVPPDVCKSELFPDTIKLLMDNETDIRVLMCTNIIPYFGPVEGETFLNEVVPIAQLLSDDAVVNVRKACAEMIVSLAVKITNESKGHVVHEMLAKVMEDEDSLVRLRLLKELTTIARELPTLCNQLTAKLRGHFQDKNWRVRKHLIEAMPAVLQQMGQEFFVENYMMEFLPLLGDEVEEVRNAAANALPSLATASTPLWIQEKIFPTVRQLSTEGDFIHRISFLNSLKALMEVELPESFQTEVITLMIASTNDTVPNVRLRAAQVLGYTSTKIGADGSRMQIRPILNELAQDKDRDVQHFANEALKLC